MTSKRCARRRTRDRESGASAVEMVVVTPLLFLIVLLLVQVGLSLFARHVAQTAAQEGARDARQNALNMQVAWPAGAENRAKSWADNLLGQLVTGNGVTATPIGPLNGQEVAASTTSYPEVGIRVNFTIASVVPFMSLTMDAQSQGPVECFYDQNGKCLG